MEEYLERIIEEIKKNYSEKEIKKGLKDIITNLKRNIGEGRTSFIPIFEKAYIKTYLIARLKGIDIGEYDKEYTSLMMGIKMSKEYINTFAGFAIKNYENINN